MTDEVRSLCKRFERAKDDRLLWSSVLQEAYRLGAPGRMAAFGEEKTAGPERPRRYDSTLAVACRDGARLRHSTVTPMHTKFLKVVPAPAVVEELRREGGEDAVRRGKATLEWITDRFFDELNASNFHSEIAAAYAEEQISTGILRFDEETDPTAGTMFCFRAVPLDECFFEVGPYGDVTTVWQERVIKCCMVEYVWPNAKVGERTRKRGEKDAHATVTLIEGVVHDPETGTWRHVVIDKGQEDGESGGPAIIFDVKKMKTSPWIVFMSARESGENHGTGPALTALPDAQTANKIKELLLKNAGMGITGMWQCDDDGVINPAAIKLVPGAVIPKAVGSAGLQPLTPPGVRDGAMYFNLLERLQRDIRYAVVGPELPPVDSPSMTASEAKLRIQEANLIRVPENMRVHWQLVQRGIVPRALDIMRRRGVVPEIGAHAGLMRVVAAGPIAEMQQLAETMSGLAAYSQAAQVSPEGTDQAAPARDFAAWLLDHSSFPARLIKSKAERDAAAAQQAQQQQMLAEAEAAQKAAPMVGAITKSPDAMQAMQGGGMPDISEL